MIACRFWPSWLHQHKIGAALLGAALAAASLFGVFHIRVGDSRSRFAAARSVRAAADAWIRANRLEQAEQTYRQTLVALDSLIAGWPSERSFRRERVEVLDAIGVIQAARGQPDAAVSTDQQVIALWSMLVAEDPGCVDDRLRMAACIDRLGLRLREAGRWDEAEDVYQRGRRLCEILPIIVSDNPRIRQQLAHGLEQLALLLLDMGRGSEALECYAGAVRAQTAAARSSASGSAELARLVSLLVEQSRALIAHRRSPEAERALVEAVSLAERLRTSFPAASSYQDLTASALSDLAKLIQASPARAPEARDFLNRALAIREKLVVQRPGESDTLAKLAATYVSLANVYRDQESTGEAEAFYRKALSHYLQLTSDHPQVIAYRFGHGQALHKLADLLRERGRSQEAQPLARESIQRLSDVYAGNIRNPEYRAAISQAYWTFCTLELDRKNHREAARAVREYLRIEPNGFEEALESARFLCRCTQLGHGDQSTPATERDAMARAYTNQAMEALKTAFRNGFRDVNDLKTARTYEPLRDRDDFQRLVRNIEARVESMGQIHRS
jgi:tetratricopeptide (TPR) repeat protein